MTLLTPVFLIGWMALVAAFLPYPLLDWSTLRFLFLAAFAVSAVLLRSLRGRPIGPASLLAAALPWLSAAAFWANGALDQSQEVAHSAAVVETHYSYRSGIFDSLIVRSWRPGHDTESVRVNAYQPFFRPGEIVTVGVKNGALGIPWVSGVAR